MAVNHKDEDALMMSLRLSKLVVPTIGAVTCGFARTHAIAICAIDTPRAFAICSTLPPNTKSLV